MATSLQKINVKIQELCRTCLAKEIELHSVFDEYIGTVTLDFIVTSITGVKVERDDGLPPTICEECKQKATNAFHFKQQSQEADVTLRGIYKTEKTDSIVVEIKQLNEKGKLEDCKVQPGIDVKIEQVIADDGDDFIDSDCGAPYNNDSEDVPDDTVKIEQGNQDAVYVQCDSLQENSKKKNKIKIEYEETNGSYCPLCSTTYADAENLTKHIWENHSELMGPKKRGRPKKTLTSTILNKLSENGFYLKSVPVKKYECILCKEAYKTKKELGTHILQHKEAKILCCMLCKKMYLKQQNFKDHPCTDGTSDVKKSQSTDTSLENIKPIVNELSLQEVLDPNSDMENINVLQVCRVCSGVFFSEADLVSHNDTEHPELSQRCNICRKTFASVKSAARHISICKQVERKHACNTCGLKFAYEISLNKHILRHHEGQSVSVKFMDTKSKQEEKEFRCDTCNRAFQRRDLLVKHTKVHMPLEKYFECDVCKKKFNRRDNLRSHQRVHEENRDKTAENNCLCLYCGRSFSNSSNLIVHMRRHTGEKPYKCDFCGKGFPRSYDLQCHRRSHTGEKPCVCRVCGKGFSRSNKLSRHMRVHTGQKPYKCTYCEKAFSQSNDLTLHIRRHTGDKPYICEVCGDRFIQGTALHNHRRAHGHFPPAAAEPQPQSHVQGLTYTVQNITH